MTSEGGWIDCQEGLHGVFAHRPSKPLMFALGKRTPWPGLMSSYVAGNRIKSSHSGPRWCAVAVLEGIPWCTLQGHGSGLRWSLLADGPLDARGVM